MRLVVRNPMYDKRHIYQFHIDEFDTFYGEQLPLPSWVERDSICISAPHLPSKMRIIPKHQITMMDDKHVNFERQVSDTPKTIKIAGSKGAFYTVTVHGAKKTCTCAGFSFRRSCKHIINI
jgi:hypothetical protein